MATSGESFAIDVDAWGRNRTFCRSCLALRQKRYPIWFVGWIISGLIIGFLLLRFTSQESFGWSMINLSLFQIIQVVVTLIHEFGHAVAGRAMGLVVHGVEIGLGPLVWSARMLGHRVKLRSVPFGGLTLVEAKDRHATRLRWGVMVAAGPFANLLLFGAAWAWITRSGGNFAWLRVPTSVPALFFWTNAFAALFSLFPARVITSHGRIPNDGLTLVQLAIGSGIVSAPEPPNSLGAGPGRWLRRFVQLIIWFSSVVCLAIALLLWLSEHDPSSQTVRLWIGFLFVGLGLTLIWLGVRAGKPWRLSTSGSGNSIEGCNFTFDRQLAREIRFARSALGAQTAGNFEAALQARDWSRVLVEAERLPIEQHANAAVALFRGEALLQLNRHAEATVAVESVLGQPGLGWALRTFACVVRLRALLRDSCVDAVTAAVDAWCCSDVPLVSKLVLLDGIVCEVLYHERRGLLPAAESWARKAVALCPTDLSIKGSLGSVLVESGRYEEAEPLLRETYEQSLSPNDQRICAFYLALIAKSRNQTNLAHRLAAEAMEARDQSWLVARLRSEFPDVSWSTNQNN